MEPHIISTEEMPVLDEAAFQQLLAAAFVLQEERSLEQAYSEVEQAPLPTKSPATTLSVIAETQELLRAKPYDLSAAAEIITDRLQEITKAIGVAIAIVRKEQLEYCAARGTIASLVGTHVPVSSDLFPPEPPAAETLQVREEEPQLFHQLCQEHGAKSSLALPLYYEGKVSGLLEVHFADADSIQEQEIRSCQLMAGLMTEAIARVADRTWKQALATERATMLDVLERIRPQLERLAGEPAAEASSQTRAAKTPNPAASVPGNRSASRASSGAICQCGYRFGAGELFCGKCGTPRAAQTPASGDLQSKWASLWQQSAEQGAPEEPESHNEGTELSAWDSGESLISPALEKMIARFSEESEFPTVESPLTEDNPVTTDSPLEADRAPEGSSALVLNNEAATGTTDLQPLQRELEKSPWTSATSAREWLESLRAHGPARVWLTQNRANLWLGVAVVLLLVSLAGWDTHPPQYRTVQSKNSPQARLTFFEKALISFGLAEAPAAPVYRGNPNTQVWEDLHTALYYCPGSDLYGKTPGGKFTTQRDAQLDSFEPASRKNCD